MEGFLVEVGEEAEKLIETVPAHVEHTLQGIARLHATHEAGATPLQRMLERVTKAAGRPRFVAL